MALCDDDELVDRSRSGGGLCGRFPWVSHVTHAAPASGKEEVLIISHRLTTTDSHLNKRKTSSIALPSLPSTTLSDFRRSRRKRKRLSSDKSVKYRQ